VRLRVKVAIPKGKLLAEQLQRTKSTSTITKEFPRMMRFGPGSLDEQIRQRTHFTPAGGRVPWQEPAYASGRATFNVVDLLEDIMWEAARGGPGSITRSTPFSATVGVDDRIIRARSAELGNQIVSNAEYFGFVTGDFQERTSPAAAKPSKPTKSGKGVFPFNTAMYWFLKLQFRHVASASELESGLMVPPKNMGVNPVMIARLATMAMQYIMTGKKVAA
jgi:hypothetical protein